MENLEQEEENRPELVRLPLSWGVRNDALKNLFRMNITEASLFPDLQGFASSLRNMLIFKEEILEPSEWW
jgi:hypothetical protein